MRTIPNKTPHPLDENHPHKTQGKTNVVTSAFGVIHFKFGLYWRHYNAISFSPLALVPKKVLVGKNLVLPLSILSLKKYRILE